MIGVLILCLSVIIAGNRVSAAPEHPTAPADDAKATIGSPDGALGGGWRSSTDVVVASSADTDGFHVYLARERDAFRFERLATLTDSANATGSWTGHACLTGSGRYVVAVYAPASYTNRPALMEAGGTAVVIDVARGRSTRSRITSSSPTTTRPAARPTR
ncbi:hypothetical protein Athai_21760 [Actinocatenispora thailandica]|uniref:Uncharacterized protein n=1 Tax=Actinocatenispora thailandica TaxID=227318 RepID=A0A7R7HX18_9ACTN|nr:hypothetical protein Athai_21760 [Actinocatenispora thailandica]